MNEILQSAFCNPLCCKLTIIIETIGLGKSSLVHCFRYKGNSVFNLYFLQQHSALTFDIQQNTKKNFVSTLIHFFSSFFILQGNILAAKIMHIL